MHGRLKVKSTAEQAEAKRIEREKKLQAFQGAIDRIFQKRRDGELDEEGMGLTGKVLSSNPDVYSLWNHRREILLHWAKDRDEATMTSLYSSELELTEHCLLVNPKSYGAWHQRCWVMGHTPSPSWPEELSLCNKYLQMDERNFHCWDYRRFVVKHHNVLPQAELDYTTHLISTNFSNYSSWHYRSKLLPKLHADPEHASGIQENVLLKEFELAQNAFFTDPNDQSAWFYHRWLLGRGDVKVKLLNGVLDLRDGVCVYLAATKHIKADECFVRLRVKNGPSLHPTWTPLGEGLYSKTFMCTLSGNDAASFLKSRERCMLQQTDVETQVLQIPRSAPPKKPGLHWGRNKSVSFSLQQSSASHESLKQELEACQQLHELEPDNKWTLLTIVLLMRALDPRQYSDSILQHLDMLCRVDSLRENYYKDLKSRYVVEDALDHLQLDEHSLDLQSRKLTRLVHLEHMLPLQCLNIADNDLERLPDLSQLPFLTTLQVDVKTLVSSLYEIQKLSMLEQLVIHIQHEIDEPTMQQLKRLETFDNMKSVRVEMVENTADQAGLSRLRSHLMSLTFT